MEKQRLLELAGIVSEEQGLPMLDEFIGAYVVNTERDDIYLDVTFDFEKLAHDLDYSEVVNVQQLGGKVRVTFKE